MRVVKKASGPKTKRFECDGCKARLEVSGSDLTFKSDDRDGAAYTFKCQECKKVNWIDASLIPDSMRATAK